jgi:F-type H+/Na+-transporting ATPase subunit beta
VKIADTVRGFKEIISGKYDSIPEQAFYMKGPIEDVLAEAEKMKSAGAAA